MDLLSQSPEVSTRAKFLNAAEVCSLAVKQPTQPFPEDLAQTHRVFELKNRNKVFVNYTATEQKQLSAWYHRIKHVSAEGDELSAEAKRSYSPGDLSIKGFKPDHLGFDPLPIEGILHPKLKPHLGELMSGSLRPLIRLTSSPRFYPWCTIGIIMRSYPPYTNESARGTGFVFGGRVMLTARHLFPRNIKDSFNDGVRYRFVPAYNPKASDQEPFGSAQVVEVRGKATHAGSFLGDGFWGDPSGWDYAACRLDWRIGDVCGGMGVYSFGRSDSYEKPFFHSTGYPEYNKNVPVTEMFAKIRDVDGNNYERELETVNFAAPGWSGGPLFGYLSESGDTRVVGVCSGLEVFDSFLPPYSNCVWAGGRRFVNLAQYTVENWWD